MNITVIIPTYNEGFNIRETIRKLQFSFEDVAHHCMTILVFDSCSVDNTVEQVKYCQEKWSNIKLLTEPRKSGLGSAYIQAMQYAMTQMNADAVVEFDADGSHSATDLLSMIKKINQGYDVVIGSRYVKGGTISVNWPFYRLMLSRLGNWVARFFLTSRYKDFTSGFRITRSSFLKKIDLHNLLSVQYGYKIHLLWILHKLNANIVEVPIQFVDRTHGESKLPRHTILDSMSVLLRIRFREFATYFKVCACGMLGMLVQIIFFNLLVRKFSPTLSNSIAVELAIVTNFLSNNFYTFSNRGQIEQQHTPLLFSKFIRFNLCSFFSLVLQIIIMHVGVQIKSTSLLTCNVLLFSGILLGSFINYLVYAKVIWK